MPRILTDLQKFKARQTLKRKIWSASIAYDAFKNTLTTAKHYTESGLTLEHPLHYTYVSSIVVTYCKLFTGANVLPELPPPFSKFDDPDLETTHKALLIARNNVYAHSDATFRDYALTVFAEVENNETVLTLQGYAPHLTAISIPYIIRLCEIQLERVRTYRIKLVHELLPEKLVLAVMSAEHSTSTVIHIKWPRPTDSPNSW